MRTKLIALATVGVMTLAAGAANAQGNPPSWETYQSQQQDYQRQQDVYRGRQDDYQRQRQAYEMKRQQWLRDQAAYDRRYGRGAYVRRYGDWRYDDYQTSGGYGQGGYDRGGYDRNYYDNDYYRPYQNSPCETKKTDRTVAGAVIGALAGAALGSNAAARNARTEGAVLGALVGGVGGGTIGRSSAKCDDNGYWYSRDQTISYRESGYDGRNSGQYGYNDYQRQGCRLAPAPADVGGQTEYRYVRVCPDRSGRYRITN